MWIVLNIRGYKGLSIVIILRIVGMGLIFYSF